MTRQQHRLAAILFSPLVTGALSIGSSAVAGWLLERSEPAGSTAVLAALLPAPFFVLFLIARVHWTRRLDELGRQVQLEALGITAVGSAATTFIVGYLQRAGVVSHSTWDDAWIYMAVIYLLSWAWASRRYR